MSVNMNVHHVLETCAVDTELDSPHLTSTTTLPLYSITPTNPSPSSLKPLFFLTKTMTNACT
jgi:hypothetical protein